MTYDDEEDWKTRTTKKKPDWGTERNYCKKEKPEHNKKKKNKDKK